MGCSDSKVPAPPSGTVLLHAGIKRGPYTPSFSPFVLKLETYMRIAKIPYQYTEKGGTGAKGMIPWIEHNGTSVCDSHFIMQYLNKEFNIDLNRNLSPEQKATGTALRIMTEEFLNYTLDLELLVWNDAKSIKKILEPVIPIPTFIAWIFKCKFADKAKKQGIGMHSQEEVRQLEEEQLSAISALLGDKPYMLGKEPSEVDCTMMGMLGQFEWNMKGFYQHQLIKEKFPNISDYLHRIKANYFPDWDELIASSKTDKHTDATKTSQGLDEAKIPIEVK